MGSHFNLRNFGNAPPGDGNSAKPQGNSGLVRQPSVYALTFDEFQNTWGGGLGKDFGSMNMDELLKSIWNAEESQAMTNTVGAGESTAPAGNLQRQGSLTLPRTLSQKTVDEVWRDLTKESSDGTKDSTAGVGSNVAQRQQTLGEMTLEAFLARAGVVREDSQLMGKTSNSGFFSELSQLNNASNAGLALGFQQPNQINGLVGTQMMENSSAVVALNAARIKSSQPSPQQQLHQHQPHQQPPLFPKPTPVGFSSSMHLTNNAQLASPGARHPAVGIADPSVNNNLVQGTGMGMVRLGTRGVAVAAVSPANHISPDVVAKSNTSSLSPVPYVFSRGRKASAALEKVVERRQRRMIKNRESAARSRARKQAYTMELEAEVQKLKELNQELQRKQAEMMQVQKNQLLETVNGQWGAKRQCLRRTLTGPW